MTAADNDYHHGDMDVGEQERTFSGFMRLVVWGSLITAIAVFGLTLVFAVGVHWLPALVGVSVLAVVAGMLLRMSAVWYATVVIVAFLTGAAGVIGEILGRFVFS